MHVKCGHDDNESDKNEHPVEAIPQTITAVKTEDCPTEKPSANLALRRFVRRRQIKLRRVPMLKVIRSRIFTTTNELIDRTRSELVDAGNSFIAAYVRDFLEAELNF